MLLRAFDVRLLRALVAAGKEQDDLPARAGLIHAVARAPVDSQLPYALAAETRVAEQSPRQTVDPRLYARLRLPIANCGEPLGKRIGGGCGDVMANLNGYCSL